MGDYEKLLKKYYAKVFAFIYSRTQDIETTRSLTGRAFKEARKQQEGRGSGQSGMTDLFAIARKAADDHGRRRRRALKLLRTENAASTAAAQPEHEGEVIDARMGELINQLGRLSQRDQDLLALKFDAGLSYRQMADILQISEADVRLGLFRALQRLRVNLTEEDQAQGLA